MLLLCRARRAGQSRRPPFAAAGAERRAKQIPCPAVIPSTAASGPGPEAQGRRREAYKANSPSSCNPLRRRLRARSEAGGERRRERNACTASAPPPPPPGLARSRRREGEESQLPVQCHPLAACAPLRRPLRAGPEVGRESAREACIAVQRKFPVQLRLSPPPPPGEARSRLREACKANSPPSCTPLRRRLWAWPEVGGERRRKQARPAALPSATTFGPGPKSAARDAEKQIPVIAVPPSASASGPSPKSVARSAEERAAVGRSAAAAISAAAARSSEAAARSEATARSTGAVRSATAARSAAAKKTAAAKTTAAARSVALATETAAAARERRGRYQRLRRKQRPQLQERR